MRTFQIIKSLSKRKLSTTLIILQLAICLFGFIAITQIVNLYHDRYRIYSNLVDEDSTLVVDSSPQYVRDSSNKLDIINDIMKLKSSGDISDIIILRKANDSLKINGKYYTCYQASENYLTKLNLKLSKGRMFTHDEMNYSKYIEEVPIIIGSSLGKYLSINDTVECSGGGTAQDMIGTYRRIFKVVGIAEPSSLITLDVTSNFTNAQVNDYGIYAPLTIWKYYLTDNSTDKLYIKKSIEYQNQYNQKYDLDGNKITIYNNDFINGIIDKNFQIIVDKNKNIDAVKELCNKISEDNKSSIKFEQLKNINSTELEFFRQIFMGFLIFTIVLFTFSILGVSGTTLYSINSRKREFGIRLSQGSTLEQIAQMILFETLFRNIIAFIIVVIPYKFTELLLNKYFSNNIELSYMLKFDLRTILVIFLLVLITTFLTTIVPIRKIMRLDIVEIIRGKS